MTKLKKKTNEQLLALFNRCELDENDEFNYEGSDGELMTAIEEELDNRSAKEELKKRITKFKTYKCHCGAESVYIEKSIVINCLRCRKSIA